MDARSVACFVYHIRARFLSAYIGKLRNEIPIARQAFNVNDVLTGAHPDSEE